ncbi:glycosyltransferase family protein [Bacillus sp. NEAU-Y102]
MGELQVCTVDRNNRMVHIQDGKGGSMVVSADDLSAAIGKCGEFKLGRKTWVNTGEVIEIYRPNISKTKVTTVYFSLKDLWELKDGAWVKPVQFKAGVEVIVECDYGEGLETETVIIDEYRAYGLFTHKKDTGKYFMFDWQYVLSVLPVDESKSAEEVIDSRNTLAEVRIGFGKGVELVTTVLVGRDSSEEAIKRAAVEFIQKNVPSAYEVDNIGSLVDSRKAFITVNKD